MKFIKDDRWEDYWHFKPQKKIKFSIFEQLDYCSWNTGHYSVEVRIEPRTDACVPADDQIKTLDFVIAQQENIITSLFNYYQKTIFPAYNERILIGEERIARQQSELSKIFGLNAVVIPKFTNLKGHYFLEFDFDYDIEHGLSILFIDNRAIEFGAIGDLY